MSSESDVKPPSRPWMAVVGAVGTLALAFGTVVVVGAAVNNDGSDEPAPARAEPVSETSAADHSMDHGDGSTDHSDGSMDHGDGSTDHGDGSMDHGDSTDHGDQHGPGHESDVAYQDLPADVKAQVDITKALVEKYPTAADAMKDGWGKATINLKGIGAHYLKGGVGGFLGGYQFDPANPNVLLFDGEGPDAKIAGASFILTEPSPTGYPGDLDVWHHHIGVCFDPKIGLVTAEIDGHEGSSISMTTEQCTATGAQAIPIADLYMIHVWVAPEYIDDAPVFAHDHPMLYDGVGAAEQLA